VATQVILQTNHFFSQSIKIYLIQLLFLPILAYLMVLAIEALEITIAEKYRSRASDS